MNVMNYRYYTGESLHSFYSFWAFLLVSYRLLGACYWSLHFCCLSSPCIAFPGRYLLGFQSLFLCAFLHRLAR